MGVTRPTRSRTFVPVTTVRASHTYDEIAIPQGTRSIALEAKFVYGSGGTTCKVYVQTSLDGGDTWFDVACFAFATTTASKVSAVKTDTALAAASTPTDATLSDNSILDGILGDLMRVKTAVAGTYVTSTLEVVGVFN